jgi:hypothetical protein
MSGTLKVTTLQDGASSTANLTFDANANTTAGGTVAMASSFKRNRIINGNMLIDQRNAGASVTSSSNGTYFLDRWRNYQNVNSKFSVQQSSTAPTGFTKSMFMTSLSAYTIGASEFATMNYRIEGYNVADLAWGTANAKTVTLSFWAYSSLTGTFGGAIGNDTTNYVFSYSIPVANTWTQITVTIAGPTTGTWPTDNTTGIQIWFSLGAGSAVSTTAGSWTGQYWSATGAVSVVGTNGATFYITGVQLEVGTKATPYEMQIYSDQLAQCQRYYQFADQGVFGAAVSTTVAILGYYPPVQFRTLPTFGLTAAAKVDFPYTANYTQSSASVSTSFSSSTGGITLTFLNFSGLTPFSFLVLRNDGGKLTFSAEL